MSVAPLSMASVFDIIIKTVINPFSLNCLCHANVTVMMGPDHVLIFFLNRSSKCRFEHAGLLDRAWADSELLCVYCIHGSAGKHR